MTLPIRLYSFITHPRESPSAERATDLTTQHETHTLEPSRRRLPLATSSAYRQRATQAATPTVSLSADCQATGKMLPYVSPQGTGPTATRQQTGGYHERSDINLIHIVIFLGLSFDTWYVYIQRSSHTVCGSQSVTTVSVCFWLYSRAARHFNASCTLSLVGKTRAAASTSANPPRFEIDCLPASLPARLQRASQPSS